MSYSSALTKVGIEHREEIQADLAAARTECQSAESALEAAMRRVHLLEALLHPVAPSDDEISKRHEEAEKLTLHAAMQKVLRESPSGKLRAGEIIAEIERLNLYRMKDGRLPESQQIHARASHYPALFGKEGSFFYAR